MFDMKTTGYVLPPIRQDSFSNDGWFPTRAQCFIYRNWECASAERMAKVLNTEALADRYVLNQADDEEEEKWGRTLMALLQKPAILTKLI